MIFPIFRSPRKPRNAEVTNMLTGHWNSLANFLVDLICGRHVDPKRQKAAKRSLGQSWTEMLSLKGELQSPRNKSHWVTTFKSWIGGWLCVHFERHL